MRHWTSHLLFEPDPMNDLAAPMTQWHIGNIIAHRAPFLLIDQIDTINLQHRLIRATRRIDPEDPVMAGHVPGCPTYPGTLQLEALFQTALVLAYFLIHDTHAPPASPEIIRAVGTRVYDVCHPHPVRPGDVMTLRCRVDAFNGLLVIATAQATVDDRVASISQGEFYVV